jgi:hypothetical protein
MLGIGTLGLDDFETNRYLSDDFVGYYGGESGFLYS